MKIQCPCGVILNDDREDQPDKARFVPDQKWTFLLEAVDWLIENRCHNPKQRDEACTQIRVLMDQLTRAAWQCPACGRMFVEDAARDLHCYPPGPTGTSHAIFREMSP